ncbi:MAG: iron-containing alcohol dehydrogenase [Paludibacteraceae bacterium]|nr:iron-containing alcohol dehydrogenase [Paludibacteraceae bacterium]MBP5481682.1 iron-containing alcohol dehydrogenase [Paludibacteraceae bacterium]
MDNFSFQCITKYCFGKDQRKTVGSRIKPFASKVLLVYGGGSIKRNGVYDDVTKSLKEEGISFVELSGIQANPTYEKVLEGIEIAKKEQVQLILAVGGGSVIDTSKAIAMGYYEADVWSFYERGGEVSNALPVATVLTIPAAGSEVSPDTVISYKGRKLGYSSQKIRPVVSVVDPVIFFTLPKNQIAYGVCDMMSHIFERYFTQTNHTELIDSLCEATLKTIMRNAYLLIKNPQDYEAWSEVSLAGSVAHNGFLGCGRIQDWGCHDMEHELSAQDCKVPHGAGLAVLTPNWMRHVYKENPKMFYQFAVNVMGIKADRDEEKTIHRGIDKLRAFFTAIGLPATLTELGLGANVLEEMAGKCVGNGHVGNFKPLFKEDVLEIYRKSL